jgi:catechol 2,3-dioxygenase-like lactoylglutathione lyase family enzyme
MVSVCPTLFWPAALLAHGRSIHGPYLGCHERRQPGKETVMLANSNATANLAVKDLARAKAFYEETLGLKQVDEMAGDLIVYKSGDTVINVYRSEFAGTNKATALTWTVGGEIGAIVQALKSKGVAFEHYEMPGLSLEGDVHVGYGMKVEWFKDPVGNILCIAGE